MDSDTRKLLQDCTSGCRMAIESLEQVEEAAGDEKVRAMIRRYRDRHVHMEGEACEMLHEDGAYGEEPGLMASAFAKIAMQMKLLVNDDSSQIAKILMDGGNMGVKAIGEALNKYKGASAESREFADRMIKLEDDMMQDFRQFL